MNSMQRNEQARQVAAVRAEAEFHKTGKRNALGGFIGCDGPECWALIKGVEGANVGLRVQGVR